MARYINTIATDEPPVSLNDQISGYLTQEGFKQIDAGTNTWRKGMGIMLGPQFVSFRAEQGKLTVEAWIKYAVLPGLYIGEMGITGAFAFIPKRKLKARVDEIEHMA